MTEQAPNVGIIGTHVNQSLSPIMHNAAYREMGVDLHYGTFELGEVAEHERVEYLAVTLDELTERGVIGLSVTMPFKRDVLECERLLPTYGSVRAIQAANTLSKPTEGAWLADNTDWIGAVDSLLEAGMTIEDSSALIIGAGGTARAVAYGLSARGAHRITIANRTRNNAKRLAQEFQGLHTGTRFSFVGLEDLEQLTPFDIALLREVDVVYNTTNIGQDGTTAEGQSPLTPQAFRLFRPETVVNDAVYMPLETPLLRMAQARGDMRIVNGTRMLLHQAVEQVRIFTNTQDVPIDAMDRALQEEIMNRQKAQR